MHSVVLRYFCIMTVVLAANLTVMLSCLSYLSVVSLFSHDIIISTQINISCPFTCVFDM